jgi:hypothetical protein
MSIVREQAQAVEQQRLRELNAEKQEFSEIDKLAQGSEDDHSKSMSQAREFAMALVSRMQKREEEPPTPGLSQFAADVVGAAGALVALALSGTMVLNPLFTLGWLTAAVTTNWLGGLLLFGIAGSSVGGFFFMTRSPVAGDLIVDRVDKWISNRVERSLKSKLESLHDQECRLLGRAAKLATGDNPFSSSSPQAYDTYMSDTCKLGKAFYDAACKSGHYDDALKEAVKVSKQKKLDFPRLLS